MTDADDGTAGGDARAQVALSRRLDVVPVLDVDGLVEPVLLTDLLDCLRICALAEKSLRRSTREGPDPDEDENREPEQDRDEEQESADDEAQHRRPPTLARTSCYSSIVTVENNSFVVGLATYPFTFAENARAGRECA